jgi:hypothetical protein
MMENREPANQPELDARRAKQPPQRRRRLADTPHGPPRSDREVENSGKAFLRSEHYFRIAPAPARLA